jgi:coenzyme F420 hydrogenase subunit beta
MDLVKKVLEPERCSGCSACTISCPYEGILGYRDEKPVLVGECKLCGICTMVCHKYAFDRKTIEETFFGRERLPSERFGVVRKVVVARSKSPEILRSAQDGGVATTLLVKALEDGLIDAALLSGKDSSRPWAPKPTIASTRDEIIACSGTRYSYSPNLITLPEAIKRGFRRIAVVGTPCTISGVRKMQLLGLKRLMEPVKFLVGLMCSACFDYSCFMQSKIGSCLNVDPSDVTKVNIKGKVLVDLSDGSRKQILLEEVGQCARKSCGACDDFSSEFADISLGGAGLSSSTLAIARSKKGEDLLSRSTELLEVDDSRVEQSLDLVNRLSKAKRQRASNLSTGS